MGLTSGFVGSLASGVEAPKASVLGPAGLPFASDRGDCVRGNLNSDNASDSALDDALVTPIPGVFGTLAALLDQP